MKIFLILVLMTYSLNGYSLDLDDELSTKIFTFLDSVSVGLMGKTSKRFHNNLARNSVSGSFLREQSRFTITTTDGEKFFLKEFLEADRQAISKVKNVDLLLKEKPREFIKILLKSAPHTSDTIESDLKSFYQDTFQIEKLIDSLPQYETPQQKLADILFELITWTEVWDQVGDLVRVQAEAQIQSQLWNQVWDQVEAQVGDQLRSQVWDQLWDLAKDQIKPLTWAKVVDQVTSQVGGQLAVDLQNFQFLSAYRDGILNETLKTAIDFVFMVYQLSTFAMRHTHEFKIAQSEFANSLSNNMTEEKAQQVLSKLIIPAAPDGKYLIDTQLKLIKRYIQLED